VSKLEERRKQYGIPATPCLPQGKKVVVWRLPLKERTVGGIIIPEEHANPEPTGVLIAAGLKARDCMRDALMEVGDIVWLPRFTTNSPEVAREGAEKGKHVELLNIEDLVGSVDGQERLESDYEIAYDEDNGEHFYKLRATPKHTHDFLGSSQICACGAQDPQNFAGHLNPDPSTNGRSKRRAS
jgi:co-chaperonin GroES (HSP10)